MQKKKDEIPEEVIDYCIDNKISIEEGLKAFIEMKLEKVENDLTDLKEDVESTIEKEEGKIAIQEMDDIENFLNFINKQVQDD
jgi:hypothetical protein